MEKMTPSKKVLFTSHTANFSKFNRPFMRWFSQQGYKVHYASAGEEEVLDCDKHFTVSFNRSPWSFNNIRAYRQLKKVIGRENYALIHTHTPMGSVVTRLAARKARKMGTKVIYTAHGFHFYNGAPLLNWLLYYPIEKLLARYTDVLITINEEDYNRAKAHFGAVCSVQKMDGVGVDLASFSPPTSAEKNRIRASLNISKDFIVLIYVAEFIDRKRHDFIVKALPRIVEHNTAVKVLFAGDGQTSEAIKELVRELGLEDNVQFLGYRKDVDKLLKASDIAISSSVQEGLPVNAIEGMASGLPLVCARIRGNVDIITQGRNGILYDAESEEQFTDSLGVLISNYKKRRDIGKANVRDAKRYSVEKAINSLALIYGSVLSSIGRNYE